MTRVQANLTPLHYVPIFWAFLLSGGGEMRSRTHQSGCRKSMDARFFSYDPGEVMNNLLRCLPGACQARGQMEGTTRAPSGVFGQWPLL